MKAFKPCTFYYTQTPTYYVTQPYTAVGLEFSRLQFQLQGKCIVLWKIQFYRLSFKANNVVISWSDVGMNLELQQESSCQWRDFLSSIVCQNDFRWPTRSYDWRKLGRYDKVQSNWKKNSGHCLHWCQCMVFVVKERYS